MKRSQATSELKATVGDCCMRYTVRASFDVSRFYPATFHSPAEGGEIEIYRVEILKAEICGSDGACEVTPVRGWPESLLESLAEQLVEDDDFCARAREHTGVY